MEVFDTCCLTTIASIINSRSFILYGLIATSSNPDERHSFFCSSLAFPVTAMTS